MAHRFQHLLGLNPTPALGAPAVLGDSPAPREGDQLGDSCCWRTEGHRREGLTLDAFLKTWKESDRCRLFVGHRQCSSGSAGGNPLGPLFFAVSLFGVLDLLSALNELSTPGVVGRFLGPVLLRPLMSPGSNQTESRKG